MLSPYWITEKNIDYEYKMYQVLGYFQKVESFFRQSKLFPYYDELKTHYDTLLTLKNTKQEMSEAFPRQLEKIDFKKKELLYKQAADEEKTLEVVNSIIEFSLPKFEHYVEEGKLIYNFVKGKLTIQPIGLVPLYVDEGYFLLKTSEKSNNTTVYQYTLTLFENDKAEQRSVRSQYITTFTTGISESFEKIKSRLIQYFPAMPNPATFAIESELTFPEEETFLPVAKHLLEQYISTAKAA